MDDSPVELVVACKGRPSLSDLNLIKLAGFMGLRARFLFCDGLSGWGAGELRSLAGQGACLAASASALRGSEIPDVRRLMGPGTEGGRPRWLIYGFDPAAGDSELVARLSGGALRSVRQLGPGENQYSFCADAPDLCGEFSGLAFGPADPGNGLVFERASGDARVREYVRIGQNPHVVGLRDGGLHVVLAGTRTILNIDSRAPNARVLNRFSELVPAMLFLRSVFGDRCWHPARKSASFIVDDPLLQPRYGFLRYGALLDAMERSDFATNVSFIPWNYRRSDSRVTQLFKGFPQRLSLSVHGCDHTQREFAAEDERLLLAKAHMAMERMKAHQRLTGLPFDRVMVFPRAQFSAAALRALKATGYLAAVNSTPFAGDQTEPDVPPQSDLRWRDLLEVAVARYGNFPLFVRRYPNRIADLALHLFLGKPAFVVEHHGYFRGGYDEIEAFAQQVSRLSSGITWCGLESAVRHAALWRRDADGTVCVKFYSGEPIVVNRETESRRFRFESELLSEPARVPLVTLDGQKISPWADGERFGGEVELQPGTALRIKVAPLASAGPGNAALAEGLLYRAGVFTRRMLCEFRDNYVSPALVRVRGH
jgi:hypothetical protein